MTCARIFGTLLYPFSNTNVASNSLLVFPKGVDRKSLGNVANHSDILNVLIPS